MGRTKVATDKDKLTCIRCGSANQSNFYVTKDPKRKFFGKIPYCKDCVKKMYDEYLKKYSSNPNLAIYYLCRKVDLPYIHSNYLGAIENINNPNAKLQGDDALLFAYIKGLGLSDQNGWGYTFDDSQGENEIEGITSIADKARIKRKSSFYEPQGSDEVYEEIEYDTDDLLDKWGNFDIEDLVWLESEYLDWDEKLAGISEKTNDIMVQEICKQRLEIRKDREQGISVEKKIATLQTLLKNSGLIEKQKSAIEFKQVGMPTRDIEFKRPLKTVDKDLDDVDNVKRMVIGITGGLCRSLGIENQYTQGLDDLYKDFSIDIIEDGMRDRTNNDFELPSDDSDGDEDVTE